MFCKHSQKSFRLLKVKSIHIFTVFTSRNWNQTKQLALVSLIKVFTVFTVTMQNTGKSPRFLILFIYLAIYLSIQNNKNPTPNKTKQTKNTTNPKNSQSFLDQSFVTKCKFALHLIMTYSSGIKTASKSMC